MRLRVVDGLSSQLLSLKVSELYAEFGGPTLIRLPGPEKPPLFISCLLHGNEHSGFQAIQSLLQYWKLESASRPMLILLGNLKAASQNRRVSEDHLDYNRIWEDSGSEQGKWTEEVVSMAKNAGIYAAIDIHNNTGKNPHYAVTTTKHHQTLQLASLFARTTVYVPRLQGTLISRFSSFCPSVVLECGKSQDTAGARVAKEYLQACLKMDHLPQKPVAASDHSVYESCVRLRVPKGSSFDFSGTPKPQVDFSFIVNLDDYNFSPLKAGQVLGYSRADSPYQIEYDVLSAGEGPDFVRTENGAIVVQQDCTPAMLTHDVDVVTQDCLGYLMLSCRA